MKSIAALLLVAALAGGLYWVIQQDRKRTHALQAAAERLGLGFRAEAETFAVPAMSQFELFGQGRRHRVRNLVSGTHQGHEVALFDFSYVVGRGRSRQRVSQTVLYVRVPGMQLPRFALRPEHILHRIGGRFGYQDIDLDNDPVFSGQYLLRGADEAAIRALFGAGLRDFYDRIPGACTEGAGPDFIFWYDATALKADEVAGVLDLGVELAGRLHAAAGTPGGAES